MLSYLKLPFTHAFQIPIEIFELINRDDKNLARLIYNYKYHTLKMFKLRLINHKDC